MKYTKIFLLGLTITAFGFLMTNAKEPLEANRTFSLSSIFDSVAYKMEFPVREKLLCSITCNPDGKFISLHVDLREGVSYQYYLFDAIGNTIFSNVISEHETQISSGDLPASAYYIKVYYRESVLSTFKVVKN